MIYVQAIVLYFDIVNKISMFLIEMGKEIQYID